MTLIVEDGSIVAGAESYMSVADATAYHAARGNAAWTTLGNPAMEVSLRRATDFMTAEYGWSWAGRRMTSIQALDWPRYQVRMPDGCAFYPSNAVPEVVRRACAELALRDATSKGAGLAPDIKPQAVSVKIGPIEKVYAQTGTQKVRIRAVDDMLAPVLAAGGSLRVVRA